MIYGYVVFFCVLYLDEVVQEKDVPATVIGYIYWIVNIYIYVYIYITHISQYVRIY